jgi:hypothetical protein
MEFLLRWSAKMARHRWRIDVKAIDHEQEKEDAGDGVRVMR